MGSYLSDMITHDTATTHDFKYVQPLPASTVPVARGPGDEVVRTRHLRLAPNELADYVLLVEDAEHVGAIAAKCLVATRADVRHGAFRTITGTTREGPAVTITACGIGAATIDLVFGELAALREIDLEAGMLAAAGRPLAMPFTVVRLGTCETVHDDAVPLGTVVVVTRALGLDGACMHYGAKATEFADGAYWYDSILWQTRLRDKIFKQCTILTLPYTGIAHDMGNEFADALARAALPSRRGVVVSTSGYFGSRGRWVLPRLVPRIPDAAAALEAVCVDRGMYLGYGSVLGVDSGTAVFLRLANMAGYRCGALCVATGQMSTDAFLGDEALATVVANAAAAAIQTMLAKDGDRGAGDAPAQK